MTHVNVPALANIARPVIEIHDGKVTTTSIEVSRVFGKRHDNVMRDIQNLRADLDENRLLNFEETVITRPNPSGGEPIKSPAYHLTRDGFTLLTFGFTGKKALAFKLAYIDAFNKMEAALAEKAQPAPQQLGLTMDRSLDDTGITPDMIQDIVASTTQNLVATLQQKRKLIHWPEVIEALQNPHTDMSFPDLTALIHVCIARFARSIDAEAYRAIKRRAAHQHVSMANVSLSTGGRA